jgi:hypothetical protein
VCAPLFNERDPVSGALVPDFALALQYLDGLRVVDTVVQVPEVVTRGLSVVEDPHYFERAAYSPSFSTCDGGASKWWVTVGASWGNIAATDLEVIVRRKVCTVTDSNPINPDPTPVAYFLTPLQGSIEGTRFGFYGDADTENPVSTSASAFYVSVRPVFRENGAVTSAGAWKVLGVSANSLSNDPMKNLATARGSFLLRNAHSTEEMAPNGCPYFNPVGVPGWDDCLDPDAGVHFLDGKSIPSAVYQTRVPSLVPPGLPNTAPGAPPFNP